MTEVIKGHDTYNLHEWEIPLEVNLKREEPRHRDIINSWKAYWNRNGIAILPTCMTCGTALDWIMSQPVGYQCPKCKRHWGFEPIIEQPTLTRD